MEKNTHTETRGSVNYNSCLLRDKVIQWST